MTYVRPWQEYWGEDPVDSTTTASSSRGPIVVSHFPPIRPIPTPGSSDPSSNSPPAPVLTPPPDVPVGAIKLSQESGIAPFETLFHDLEFRAQPVYNFWESGEDSDGFAQGNRDIDSVPRYVSLTWRAAPDLKDPAEFLKRRLNGQDADARDVFTKLSPFGFGSHEVIGSVQNGVLVVPIHMLPSNFPSNANNLANGHVFSGIIEAVAEVKRKLLVSPLPPTRPAILDEDQYLSDPNNAGISVSQATAALWRWNSTVYGISRILGGAGLFLSPGARLQKLSLFDGQFGISSPMGTLASGLKSINPSSPAISLRGDTAVSARAWVPKIIDVLPPPPPPESDIVDTAKIKIVDTDLSSYYDNSHINSITAPHQAENAISLVPFAGSLVAYAAAGVQHYRRDVSIPSSPSPDTVKPLEYIGYIIEKYEQVDGSYKKVDTFYIPGRDYDHYNDCKVKYGASYRYRIRSVLRWSRPNGIGILGKDPTLIDPAVASINNLTPNDVSYFGGEWDAWSYAAVLDFQKPDAPDEMTVRPISNHMAPDGTTRPAVEITFKLPYNPQMDINKMTLWRKLIDQDNREVTDWIQVQEATQNEVERQGTRHLYITDFQHEQDDATGTRFQASTRDQVETFVEYAPLNARFLDLDVGYWGEAGAYKYVYAALCHTRHGETSPLSDQLAVRLNSHWQKEGEYPVEFVSCAGVDIDFDTGPFRTYPPIRERTEVIFSTRFDKVLNSWVPGTVVLTGQQRLAQKMLNDNHYVVRVESLDNGQHVDVPVDISIKNQPEEFRDVPSVPTFTT